MMAETKREIKDNSVIIPKGTQGIIKAFQWGDKKDGIIVDFQQAFGVYISKEDIVLITSEKKEEPKTLKTHTSYEKDKKEIKNNKQKREKEL